MDIFEAARNGDLEFIKGYHGNLNAVVKDGMMAEIGYEGQTALGIAASNGKTDVVKALIKAGANVNAVDSEGWTALMVAAQNGYKDIVKVLIKAGADINAIHKGSGRTAMIWADFNGETEIVELLKKARKPIFIKILISAFVIIGIIALTVLLIIGPKLKSAQDLYQSTHFIGHTGPVHVITIAPDGILAVSGSEDHTIRAWDLATGKELYYLHPSDTYGNGETLIDITPDGMWGWSSSESYGQPVMWNLKTGKELSVNSIYDRIIPKEKKAISITDDNIKVSDLETGKELFNIPVSRSDYDIIPGKYDNTPLIEFSSECKRIIYVKSNNIDNRFNYTNRYLYNETLSVWDLTNGKKLSTFTRYISADDYPYGYSNIFKMELTPDGKRAVILREGDLYEIWDLVSGKITLKVTSSYGYQGGSDELMITSDGKKVVSIDYDKGIGVWDLLTGKNLFHYNIPISKEASIDITPDGNRMISRTIRSDNLWDLKVWDLETGKELSSLPHFRVITITPDGKRAVSSDGAILQAWDLETGKQLSTLKDSIYIAPEYSPSIAVAITLDGKRIIAESPSGDHTLQVWDLETGKVVRFKNK